MVEGEPGEELVATAKEEILWRIRRAIRDVPEDERPGDVPVERGYRKEGDSSREEVVKRFAENVAEYRATVHVVDEDELPDAIAAACERRGVERLVIPPALPETWRPEGVELLRDAARPSLTNEELDGGDGVLTGCALGIAQTGTIVLDAGPTQGRRAPDAPARLPPVRRHGGPDSGPRPRSLRQARRDGQARRPGRNVHLRAVRHLRHRVKPGRRSTRSQEPGSAGRPGGIRHWIVVNLMSGDNDRVFCLYSRGWKSTSKAVPFRAHLMPGLSKII